MMKYSATKRRKEGGGDFAVVFFSLGERRELPSFLLPRTLFAAALVPTVLHRRRRRFQAN